MDWVELLLGFLGGSVLATLVQVRAEWRRQRADRVTAGAEAFLFTVDGAMGALDELAEVAGQAIACDAEVEEVMATIEASGSALTRSPAPPELEAYGDLVSEVYEALRWPRAERPTVVRATVDRVLSETPRMLEAKASVDPGVRKQAIELGRAVSRSALIQPELLDQHVLAHQRIDASRGSRARMAISLASVPTHLEVLRAADEVLEALHTFRGRIEEAYRAKSDPRSEPAGKARELARRQIDAFCERVADAIEGPSSRRWRWRL